MALKIYYKEDILNALHSAYVASGGPSALVTEVLENQELQGIPLDKLLQVYMRGFNTALCAIGVAFGLTNLVHQERGGADRLVQRGVTHLDQGEQTPTLDLELLDFIQAAIRRQRQE